MNYTKKAAPRRHQRGMTMIEGLGWMALAALVVVGAIVANSSGWAGNKSSKDQSHISSIISNTKKLQGVTGYGASGTNLVPLLISREYVPGDMTQNAGALVNRYGGAVTVASTGLGYTVTTASLPAAACQEIAVGVSQAGGITTKIGSSAAITGPVDAPTANTQCSGSTNTIVFTLAN